MHWIPSAKGCYKEILTIGKNLGCFSSNGTSARPHESERVCWESFTSSRERESATRGAEVDSKGNNVVWLSA